MPGESIHPAAPGYPAASALTFVVEQQERTVWVTLSGILDSGGVAGLIGRVSPVLAGQGFRVVLDGRRLQHVDYRAVAQLLRWRRHLAARRHSLQLAGWSAYLQTIVSLEDWQGELVSLAAYRSSRQELSRQELSGAQRTRSP